MTRLTRGEGIILPPAPFNSAEMMSLLLSATGQCTLTPYYHWGLTLIVVLVLWTGLSLLVVLVLWTGLSLLVVLVLCTGLSLLVVLVLWTGLSLLVVLVLWTVMFDF